MSATTIVVAEHMQSRGLQGSDEPHRSNVDTVRSSTADSASQAEDLAATSAVKVNEVTTTADSDDLLDASFASA